MVRQVKKRDGKVELFDKQKIVDAVVKAMEHTVTLKDSKTKIVDYNYANEIAKAIEHMKEEELDIEYIQNIVENKLMASQYKDVAREYVKYRNERTKKRAIKQDRELYAKAKAILDCNNITNDNANVDQFSFSGKENRVGEELHKQYAMDNLLEEEVKLYFQKNYIYLHDFGKYAVGMHNCLFADMQRLLKGFETRNGDVRGANSLSTAFQLYAVIFQCQSQVQFGGVGSCHIDTDLSPYVKKSFKKHYKNGMKYVEGLDNDLIEEIIGNYTISIADERYKKLYPNAWKFAFDMLNAEGEQSAQAFYHNLNTLESRSGSQVPFTSINFGRDASPEGKLISQWLMTASLNGIGLHHKTSIFPISIFQYKKGVNDKPDSPNYQTKKLAIKSLCKRIYPNIVNCDWSQNIEDPNNPDTFMATMGCRTLIGFDRHGLGYSKIGRGNIVPTTIILPKLGIEYGVCRGERTEADLEGFWSAFEKVLETTRNSLIDRFIHIANQSPKSAPFMYNNGTMADFDKCNNKVFQAMRHNTLAIGYIGVAEMCQALFGKNHAEDKEVHEFALKVVEKIADFAKKSGEEYNLNFSAYATPAESLCMTAMKKLKAEYGTIPNVTEKDYLTNSHHVPVWHEISIFDKLKTEAPFCKYPTGGCITYIELESSIMNNEQAVEDIIDYAMSLDIPYLAFNFPIDSCLDCGYQGEFNDKCPVCGSTNIQQLRRVTGYLTTDYRNFNNGKISEVKDRVKHSRYTNFTAKGIVLSDEPRTVK